MTSETDIPCLGRPFSPGLLYDARSDKLLTLSPWNDDKLENGITTTQTHYSGFKIATGNSLKERLSLLGASGHVKVGFLCGLIESSGSASYIDGKAKKKDEVRMLLVHRADVESRRLDMKLFDKENGFDHPGVPGGWRCHPRCDPDNIRG